MHVTGSADAAGRVLGVAFDCYGTLLRLGVDRGVTRRTARLLSRCGAPSPVTSDVGIREALIAAGIAPDVAHAVGDDARREADGAMLIDGAIETIAAIATAGLRVAIGSNLSREYAEPIRRLLPGIPACLSFKVGAAKPQPAFYHALAAVMDLPPDRIVMVGDSRRCDHDGPVSAGMGGLLIGEPSEGATTVRTIADVASMIARQK